jgi:diacylglycerol kinase (ATP)
MEKLLIFANQYAGTLARVRGKTPLETYAREAGFVPELVYTRSGPHLRKALRERVIGKLSRVVIAGGDGTLHSAVQVLARSGVALGILPQGTANNFATALRLPRDLPSAFRVLAEGQERAVSLGEADGEYFTEAAGVGIFADTLAMAHCHRRTKNIWRTGRILLKLMLLNRPYRLALDLDGVRYREEAFSVTIANSFLVGRNIPIAPYARLTDEELDVVLIESLTRREMPLYYRAILAQNHIELPKVHSMRARQIQIHAGRPTAVHVDDRARKKTPVTVNVVPDGLKVIVDRI